LLVTAGGRAGAGGRVCNYGPPAVAGSAGESPAEAGSAGRSGDGQVRAALW
jgi:hypothetical protein